MKEVKTTFEEWGELLKQTGDEEDFRPIDIAKLYTAWSNERGKLIGALAQLLVFEDDHDAAGTEWHDAQKLAVEQAHAVLAEVEGKS